MTHSAHVRIFGLNIKSMYGKFKIVYTNIYTIESLSGVGNGRVTADVSIRIYNATLYVTV